MGSRVLRVLCATLVFTGFLSAPAAWAHAHLKHQEPAAESEVSTAPQSITLHFSEGVESRFSGVTLTGADDKKVETGKAVRSETDKTQLTVPINQPLASGVYTVNWHVVSVDGHKTQGQYQFRVK
ncbi:CopC domain-containing protein YobA [Pseudocitrobacter faecalis]|uniref:CopC domain-containing protein YobA n=1 Tax=Pseudocitrobacter faecalis TaxID=1398493 RepID=UPI003314FC45